MTDIFVVSSLTQLKCFKKQLFPRIITEKIHRKKVTLIWDLLAKSLKTSYVRICDKVTHN